MLLVLVDIDGTIANIAQLASECGPEPDRSNRDVYATWAGRMTANLSSLMPNDGVLETVRVLYRGGAKIAYLTSREAIHRDVTQQWLTQHGAPPGQLLMRGYADWRSTSDMKGSHIYELLEKHEGPVVALDDDRDSSVSPVYKAFGVSHLKAMCNL